MRRTLQRSCLMAVGIALVVAVAGRSLAQERGAKLKPVVVVYAASIDALIADGGYLIRATGLSEFVSAIGFDKDDLTIGLDTTKPLGLYTTFEGNEPQAVAFVAVKDLKAALAQHAERVGKPIERKNGMLELPESGDSWIKFIKLQEGWAFASDRAENLVNLPEDPAALVGAVQGKYTVAAWLNVQNVPHAVRREAIDNVKNDLRLSSEFVSFSAAEFEAGQKLGDAMREFVIRAIEESDQVTIGFTLDRDSKRILLDISITAVPGTELAHGMELLKDSPTQFAGFRLPNASASLSSTWPIPKVAIEPFATLVNLAREEQLAEIDHDDSIPNDEAREADKAMANGVYDLLESTLKDGKFDFGALLVLKQDSFTFVGGAAVSDGTAIDRLMARSLELKKNDPDITDVKANAERYGEVNLHTYTVRDVDAIPLLGKRCEVVYAVGKKSLYYAFGDEAVETLKLALDRSSQATDPRAPLLRSELYLTPILKFAESKLDHIFGLPLAVLKQAGDNDKVVITCEGIKNGVRVRLEAEEGVLPLVGPAMLFLAAGMQSPEAGFVVPRNPHDD